jgi:hypothetical protein
MPIYFSAKAIPELRGYPQIQRHTFIARAIAANAWNPFVWLSCGLAFPGQFAALTAAAIFIPAARTFLPFGLLIGIGIGGLIGLLSTQLLIAVIRPTLAMYRDELEHASTTDYRHTLPSE